MILASIEIENYKHYGGVHQIDFPEQGMVAITGPNGAGKTTLFEAIEWCLYGPRAIVLNTIPPRDGVGATKVRVTLQDPNDGRRVVVERSLRNGVTTAEAYREDEASESLVQGPRDVSDYVAKQLIGLPHAAFVSTFFTRQKELTFFGDRSPTERRVEVARLLGFQTIRDAQEEISEERNSTRARAKMLREQYELGTDGRDFDREIAQAADLVASARDRESEAQARLAEAEAAFARAREELERWRGLQEQDAAHERELLTIAGSMQAAESRREAAERELMRLRSLAEERVALVTEAATIEEWAAKVTALDADRERARRLEALQHQVEQYRRQLSATVDELEGIVEAHRLAAEGLDGWSWSASDRDDPCAAAVRLHKSLKSVDHDGARQRVNLMQQAAERSRRADDAAKKLDSYREFRRKLALERDELIRDGDPNLLGRSVQEELTAANRALQEAIAALTAAQRERRESEELEQIFGKRSFDRRCPTCTRPLSDSEAEQLVRALRINTERLREVEAARESDKAAAHVRVADLEAKRDAAAKRLQELRTLDHRLADGDRTIADQETEHTREVSELQRLLDKLQRAVPPRPEEIEAARVAAERAGELRALVGTLGQLGQRAELASDAIRVAERSIVEIGPVAYDPAIHAEATAKLEAARHAAAQVKRIDVELRSKSDYEATRDAAAGELGALRARQCEVQAARDQLGFDAAALQHARVTESAAAAERETARQHAAEARDALKDAEQSQRNVVAERDHLLKLAEDADRHGREADELDRMYREFAEFDKFVADHVGPLLAETTERLLSQVTDGKYDRVRFDENYGIEVFDGDECFRLEGFSGGERDVVALCARLAMSELVGSAALRPPRFLVLDEVFGSLDSERRGQLLETLGALASTGHFQQMFIISHIDDVQLSPVMNEAWTIEERDGVSHVNRPTVLIPAPA